MTKWILPCKTDWIHEQMLHEPTRRYAEDIYNFSKKTGRAKGYTKALEIGSAWGVSALAILVAGDGHLTSVDPDRTHAYEEVEVNGFSGRWTGIELRSYDFWRQNKEKYDLIYIDGSHLFKDVYDDLFQAWEVLEPGGILMVDDFTHKHNKDIDIDSKEPIYGISYALCCFIAENDIRSQRTTMQIWSTRKEGNS